MIKNQSGTGSARRLFISPKIWTGICLFRKKNERLQMKFVLCLLAGVLLFSSAVCAQEQQQMSLQACVDYALKNQTKMKNSLLEQKITQAKNKEVTGLALPSVDISGGINYAPLVAAFEVPNFIKYSIAGFVNNDALNQDALNDPSSNTLKFAFQPKWTTTPLIEASQVLFDPSIMVALQARKKMEELAQKNVEMTAIDLKAAVTKAYYNVLIAEKRLDLLNQNILRMQQMENEINAIYKNGMAEKIDVDRITVTLNNLKTEQNRTRQLVAITYLALKFQIGMPLKQPVALTDTLGTDNLDRGLLAENFDVQARKEFQLLTIQRDLNAYDLKRYRLGGLPTLAAFGNYGYTLYNQESFLHSNEKWQKNAMIGIKLTVPVFDGLQRRQKAVQASLAIAKNENDLDNMRSALELEEQNARIALQYNIASVQNQLQNMELAENIYNIARTKYKEGVGSSLEIMNAESTLKEAQTNYFSALFDMVSARVDLLKALGKL
jgi:outer membrane protein TolC